MDKQITDNRPANYPRHEHLKIITVDPPPQMFYICMRGGLPTTGKEKNGEEKVEDRVFHFFFLADEIIQG